MLIPSCLLAVGAILTGVLFKDMFIGHDSSQFWSSSILFLQSIQYDHPPFWLLVITPVSSYYYDSNCILFIYSK